MPPLGGEAVAVPTDTSDPVAVHELAGRAVESFGRIDVWVNNAAVTMFARFEDAPWDELRQVLDTNLFGYLHGARAALPHFRKRSGVLINNASLLGTVSQPYATPYVISKQGIRALGMVLRQELALDRARGVRACTVMPATIDTPIFRTAANFTAGRSSPCRPSTPPSAWPAPS